MTDLNPVDAMTNPYRAICAELLNGLDELANPRYPFPGYTRCAMDRARDLLAQPEPEGPDGVHPFVVRHYTDDERPSIKGNGFDGLEIGEDRQEAEEFIAWINKRIYPTPQPVAEDGDIHYAWELHDAEGEWQAGGSAITLESVRREGNHYLQTYSQDGFHTLIIYRASTIEVVTNG